MMLNAYALNDNACLTPRGVTQLRFRHDVIGRGLHSSGIIDSSYFYLTVLRRDGVSQVQNYRSERFMSSRVGLLLEIVRENQSY
jgi:hypothetical protein